MSMTAVAAARTASTPSGQACAVMSSSSGDGGRGVGPAVFGLCTLLCQRPRNHCLHCSSRSSSWAQGRLRLAACPASLGLGLPQQLLLSDASKLGGRRRPAAGWSDRLHTAGAACKDGVGRHWLRLCASARCAGAQAIRLAALANILALPLPLSGVFGLWCAGQHNCDVGRQPPVNKFK